MKFYIRKGRNLKINGNLVNTLLLHFFQQAHIVLGPVVFDKTIATYLFRHICNSFPTTTITNKIVIIPHQFQNIIFFLIY